MSFPFSDPFAWFLSEYQKAIEAKVPDPNAMQLATVSSQGTPSVRTVFFKGLIRGGLSFYTNYQSQKSLELDASQKAGLNFFWAPLAQQIRMEGITEKLTRAESEAYFRTRPRLSQIGAWASTQSQVIPDQQWLEQRVEEFEQKFAGLEVPCPENWGGYHVIPLQIEFWYGKQGRLHERFCFKRPEINIATWQQYLKSP